MSEKLPEEWERVLRTVPIVKGVRKVKVERADGTVEERDAADLLALLIEREGIEAAVREGALPIEIQRRRTAGLPDQCATCGSGLGMNRCSISERGCDPSTWRCRKCGLSKWRASRTKEQRSEAARKAHAAMTPEQRSEIARKRWDSMTPEQRNEIALQAKASMTKEQRSEIMRKRNASMTPEQRSEAMRKAHAALTPERRSEIMRKRNASMTQEQRKEIARKAKASMTKEQRSAASRKRWEKTTPEQRSENARKMVDGRKAKREAQEGEQR